MTDNVTGPESRRPRLLYAVIGLQVIVGLFMLIGGQGLVIPRTWFNGRDDFNVGFVIGIVDLLLVAGVWLGRRWGMSGVVTLSLVGIGATIVGIIQAYITPTVTALPPGVSPMALVPTIVVELLIILLLMRPTVRAYFR